MQPPQPSRLAREVTRGDGESFVGSTPMSTNLTTETLATNGRNQERDSALYTDADAPVRLPDTESEVQDEVNQHQVLDLLLQRALSEMIFATRNPMREVNRLQRPQDAMYHRDIEAMYFSDSSGLDSDDDDHIPTSPPPAYPGDDHALPPSYNESRSANSTVVASTMNAAGGIPVVSQSDELTSQIVSQNRFRAGNYLSFRTNPMMLGSSDPTQFAGIFMGSESAGPLSHHHSEYPLMSVTPAQTAFDVDGVNRQSSRHDANIPGFEASVEGLPGSMLGPRDMRSPSHPSSQYPPIFHSPGGTRTFVADSSRP